MKQVPIIDIQPLVAGSTDPGPVTEAIGKACRDSGFFYITGHGVPPELEARLEKASRAFFALPLEQKCEVAMARGGRAWRGYFPVGNELTSGRPDLKEGIYFGAELPADHPLVRAGTPLHGPNLFPAQIPELRPVVLEYLHELTRVGHTLMGAIALSLGLDEKYFADRYTGDPLILFRIFNYPPPSAYPELGADWGVGEHTDYGVLTILKQDECGGLEVKTRWGWIAAPPVPGTFVCNLGDMLDRMTGGLYRSTPHRVKNPTGKARISFPFFFDPSFTASVQPLPIPEARSVRDDRDERWDGESVHAFRGTYGEYLLGKVSKVFPELKEKVLKP